MNNQTEQSVLDSFFAPVHTAIMETNAGKRKCPSFSDKDHILSGIGRVMGSERSGRGWVQHVQMDWGTALTVGGFFESLKSARRLALVGDVSAHVRLQSDRQCARTGVDPLAKHPELDGFAVYASDGHYEEAAAHTPAIGGEIQPQGFFYSVNLRTHSMGLLDIARPVLKKEHDMHALKRLTAKTLRMSEKEGVRVIVAYDPAVIDYQLWRNWKTQGLYVVSTEKENSAAETVGLPEWDRADPRNTGVLSDEYVSTSVGYMMRRVAYRDPETGRDFSFMTSEFTLPPGLLAFIYKLRWDIEKAFDEKKNKLGVVKTWAASPESKCQQAHFVCLAHNLMLMLERQIDESEGVRDEKVEAKRAARLVLANRAAEAAGRRPNPLVTGCVRATERSLQFIRWLRYCLGNPRHWSLEIEVLRPYMKAYIS